MKNGKRLPLKGNRKAQLQAMTVPELRELAASSGMTGLSGLRKDALVKKIMQSSRAEHLPSHRLDDCLKVYEVGAYWLALEWKVTPKLLERASAALGQDWHRAVKVLRLYRVDWDDSGPHAREHDRDEIIPDETTKWFLQVDGTSFGWKVELGYRVPGGKFFSLLHSPDLESDPATKHQFPKRSTPEEETPPWMQPEDSTEVSLQIEGDITLKGETVPQANVNVDDQPVEVHDQTGQFHWRAPLHNGRVIIPVVAEVSHHRLRAVISIESSIHYLEPEKTSLG